MFKNRGSQNHGASVLVACTVSRIEGGVAEVWLNNPNESFRIKAKRISFHQRSLCAVKLLATNNGTATVLVRRLAEEPVEVKVFVSKLYFEVNGELIKFHSWAQMDRIKKHAKRVKGQIQKQAAS